MNAPTNGKELMALVFEALHRERGIERIQDFADAGIWSSGNGIVVTMDGGAQFNINITQVRHAPASTRCDRCRDETSVTTCSRYNADTICMACEADEKKLPSYEACREAEANAVRAGDYNYQHGLAGADVSALAAMRKARKGIAQDNHFNGESK